MASRGVNKVILLRHPGQDPEVRWLPGGGGRYPVTRYLGYLAGQSHQ